jgi:hypothetical protein
MFWSSALFAPQSSNIDLQKQDFNQKSVVIPKEEVETDSVDIKILTHYNMRSAFNRADRKKMRKIADDLGIKTKWLYKIIFAESGGNPKAINRQRGDSKEDTIRIKMGRAVGLIQFMPNTAIGLGTTTKALYNMTVSEQLDYVHLYYKKALHGRKCTKQSTLYMVTFVPAMVGLHDSTIIETRNTNRHNIYKNNKRFDLNKDSVITIEEVNLFISML